MIVKSVAPLPSLLAACLATGYLGAALFPRDSGLPLPGSLRQGIRNLGGGVQYVGGAYALWAPGESKAGFFAGLNQLSAGLVGAIALLLSATALMAIRGLLQRVAEWLLLGWLVYWLATLG